MDKAKRVNKFSLKRLIIFIIFLILFSLLLIPLINERKEQSLDKINIYFESSSIDNNTKNKFAKEITFSNSTEDYKNSQQFANFRPLKCGNLKDNYIFRGASPYLDNDRTYYVNQFLEYFNVKNTVSLSESKEQIIDYSNNKLFRDLYFIENLNKNTINIIPLSFETINLDNSEDLSKIISSFIEILNSDGKIYVHCALGRDRTGVYCELIEALADATYDEIVEDYMKSFENYSYITKKDYPEIYEAVKQNGVDKTLHSLTQTSSEVNLEGIDLKKCAIELLHNKGMSTEDINKFIKKICN